MSVMIRASFRPLRCGSVSRYHAGKAPERLPGPARAAASALSGQSQQLGDVEGRRSFVILCDRGDDPVEALSAAAKRFDLSGAPLNGIGAFSGVTLGFLDRTRRDYAGGRVPSDGWFVVTR